MSGPGQWIGIDRGDTSHEHLEQDLFDSLDAADLSAAQFIGTYLIRGERPHWAASISVESGSDGLSLARRISLALDQLECVDSHAPVFADPHARSGDRTAAEACGFAVLGCDGTEATIGGGDDYPVGIGVDLSGTVLLRTHGHVRPHFVGGELVLVVMPDGESGVVRPFELPVPRQCCETPEQFDARWRSYLSTYPAGRREAIG